MDKRIIIFLTMKKVLTIIVCNKFDGEIAAPYDDIEVLYTDGEYDCADIIKNAVKQANGKYIAFSDGAVDVLNAEALSAALQKPPATLWSLKAEYCSKRRLCGR